MQVRVGQFAFAIGAPFKLDYTFTYGVISGKGRSKLLATRRLLHLGLFADRRLDQSRATAAARSATSTEKSSA